MLDFMDSDQRLSHLEKSNVKEREPENQKQRLNFFFVVPMSFQHIVGDENRVSDLPLPECLHHLAGSVASAVKLGLRSKNDHFHNNGQNMVNQERSSVVLKVVPCDCVISEKTYRPLFEF
jgi:hypothetical protein